MSIQVWRPYKTSAAVRHTTHGAYEQIYHTICKTANVTDDMCITKCLLDPVPSSKENAIYGKQTVPVTGTGADTDV
jgi:hypothetical protein